MTGTYASKTTVSPEKSKAEIERTLSRYGADAFGYATDGAQAVITFRAHGRFVRFTLPIPQERVFSRKTAYEQAVRQRWRALALAIKAKLEVVETGITSFEEEFAVHMVLPNGSTVAEWLMPQIAESYESGEMPRSLLALPPGAPLALPAGDTTE